MLLMQRISLKIKMRQNHCRTVQMRLMRLRRMRLWGMRLRRMLMRPVMIKTLRAMNHLVKITIRQINQIFRFKRMKLLVSRINLLAQMRLIWRRMEIWQRMVIWRTMSLYWIRIALSTPTSAKSDSMSKAPTSHSLMPLKILRQIKLKISRQIKLKILRQIKLKISRQIKLWIKMILWSTIRQTAPIMLLLYVKWLRLNCSKIQKVKSNLRMKNAMKISMKISICKLEIWTRN